MAAETYRLWTELSLDRRDRHFSIPGDGGCHGPGRNTVRRRGERRWHTALPAFIAGAGLALAGYGGSTLVIVIGLALGMAFAEGMVGPFWAMATSSMAGRLPRRASLDHEVAANSGGYFGPDIIGLFRDFNGGFRGGLLAIAAMTLSERLHRCRRRPADA